MSGNEGMDYRSAGVDLELAELDNRGLADLVRATKDDQTLSDPGDFGGLYGVPGDVSDPVLVSSADGVGTKLKVAFLANEHGTIGQDLVNHCVNDILVQGARPLFFLDYLAMESVEEGVVPRVVAGVAKACKENGCALLGGETAQMPGFYHTGEYDLAGFIVGIVARSKILDGTRVEPGDMLLGLPSSGLHTNGYSLARRILFEAEGLGVNDIVPGWTSRSVPRCCESIGAISPYWHRWFRLALSRRWRISPAGVCPETCLARSPRGSEPRSKLGRGWSPRCFGHFRN